MAVNCNKRVIFDPDTMEAKSSLGRSASVAAHAALSDCYKGIEILESNRAATGAEGVYFHAASRKFEAAAQALRGMREILTGGEPTAEVVAWLEALDYDRLYEAGKKRGLIPPIVEEWSRLVEAMRSQDHLAATDCLISDIEVLREKIHSLAHALSSSSGGPLTAEQIEHLRTIQTALVQFAAFAQMAAYLNALEPTDRTWCRPDMANAGAERVTTK